MADVLPGFTFSRSASRYRDTSNGRFVAKQRITGLLEYRVDSATERIGNIIQGVAAKEIAPGAAQMMMRDELRRLSLSNAALGKGGIEQLNARDYGRVGQQLRDSYARMSNLLRDVESGKVSLPQALSRVEGYALDARRQFFAAQRDAMSASGRQFEEHRFLHARESCVDCIGYAQMGWVAAGTLPLPGERSRCNSYCRCTVETREVTPEMQQERSRTQLERMMAR